MGSLRRNQGDDRSTDCFGKLPPCNDHLVQFSVTGCQFEPLGGPKIQRIYSAGGCANFATAVFAIVCIDFARWSGYGSVLAGSATNCGTRT